MIVESKASTFTQMTYVITFLTCVFILINNYFDLNWDKLKHKMFKLISSLHRTISSGSQAVLLATIYYILYDNS